VTVSYLCVILFHGLSLIF